MLRAVTSERWPSAPGGVDSPAIILLHGYGSHEHDLAGLAPMLPAGLPWASLRAPIEMGFGAAAWFPLDFIDGPAGDIVGAEGTAVKDDAAVATDMVWEWIDHHLGESAQVVPLGFSQGGFMALQLLRTRPERVATTVTLAGFTTEDWRSGDDAVREKHPDVFWGRGEADQVIPHPRVVATQAWLAAHTAVEQHVYSGLAHGVNDEMMADVQAFLARTLRSD